MEASKMMLFMVLLFIAILVQAAPLAGNESEHHDLQRRQCVWDPTVKDWTCNNFPPTLAQHRYALRAESGLGRLGPGKTLFFYSNLFEPGVTNPTAYQQTEVIVMCVNWLTAHGIAASNIVSVANAYTQAGQDWSSRNERWAAEQPSQYIATLWGSAAKVVARMQICIFQALALKANSEPDVYFFTRRDEEPKSDSWWSNVELPGLTRAGGPVRRIIRADPRPNGGFELCDSTVMWERNRDAEVPVTVWCPFLIDDGSWPWITDPWAPVTDQQPPKLL